MLEIKNVNKTFDIDGLTPHKVINDLSLNVNDGDFITIIGSNGAGKSTLFSLISGENLVDSGNIIMDGRDITYLAEHKRSFNIGRLFQDPLKGTAPHMTIEENLALAYLRSGFKKVFSKVTAMDKMFFKEQLSLLNMGLEDRMDKKVGTLSGGQRQALTLLMATINSPKLLLLDEHTAALDPAAAAQVLDLTGKIVNEKNITCLMITHNMQQALKLGNRILMMDKGKIILDVSGTEKKNMTVDGLLERFKVSTGDEMISDEVLLVK